MPYNFKDFKTWQKGLRARGWTPHPDSWNWLLYKKRGPCSYPCLKNSPVSIASNILSNLIIDIIGRLLGIIKSPWSWCKAVRQVFLSSFLSTVKGVTWFDFWLVGGEGGLKKREREKIKMKFLKLPRRLHLTTLKIFQGCCKQQHFKRF